jgi:uncharacterized protein DUF3226
MAITLSTSSAPKPLEEPAVLLVDGPDDQRFFKAAAIRERLTDLHIISLGGGAQLRTTLRAVINTRGFANVSRLGIARDADTNPRGAFQSACAALRQEGLSVPVQPLVSTGSDPSTSIMIVPDINSPGELAHLLLRSLQGNHRFNQCVLPYIACIDGLGRALLLGNQRGKAELHAFLATMPDPGRRFGEAAEMGYFPWASTAFGDTRQFLNTLRVP